MLVFWCPSVSHCEKFVNLFSAKFKNINLGDKFAKFAHQTWTCLYVSLASETLQHVITTLSESANNHANGHTHGIACEWEFESGTQKTYCPFSPAAAKDATHICQPWVFPLFKRSQKITDEKGLTDRPTVDIGRQNHNRFRARNFFWSPFGKGMIRLYRFEKSKFKHPSVVSVSGSVWAQKSVSSSSIGSARVKLVCCWLEKSSRSSVLAEFVLWENREFSLDWATRGFLESTRNPFDCKKTRCCSSIYPIRSHMHKSARVFLLCFFCESHVFMQSVKTWARYDLLWSTFACGWGYVRNKKRAPERVTSGKGDRNTLGFVIFGPSSDGLAS